MDTIANGCVDWFGQKLDVGDMVVLNVFSEKGLKRAKVYSITKSQCTGYWLVVFQVYRYSSYHYELVSRVIGLNENVIKVHSL